MFLGEIRDLDYLPEFSWAVGLYFRNILENCYFEPDTILYSNRSGYDAWPNGKYPCEFLQVLQSAGSDSESFAANWKRQATIKYFFPSGEANILDIHQGGLYELIWSGDPQKVQAPLSQEDIPLGLGAELRHAIDLSALQDGSFYVPLDLVASYSCAKVERIACALKQPDPPVIHSSFVFPHHRVRPTVYLCTFDIGDLPLEEFQALIRSAVSLGTQKFNLAVHGFMRALLIENAPAQDSFPAVNTGL